MKKSVLTGLALATMLAFTGCNSSSGDNTDGGDSSSTSTSSTQDVNTMVVSEASGGALTFKYKKSTGSSHVYITTSEASSYADVNGYEFMEGFMYSENSNTITCTPSVYGSNYIGYYCVDESGYDTDYLYLYDNTTYYITHGLYVDGTTTYSTIGTFTTN